MFRYREAESKYFANTPARVSALTILITTARPSSPVCFPPSKLSFNWRLFLLTIHSSSPLQTESCTLEPSRISPVWIHLSTRIPCGRSNTTLNIWTVFNWRFLLNWCRHLYLINCFQRFIAPNFVSSVADGDYVYFFLRETAVEYINCGKVNTIHEDNRHLLAHFV